MFCIARLLESWRDDISTSDTKTSKAFEATNAIVSKYKNVTPMLQLNQPVNQPVRDVIEAEKKFGISYFRDYYGVDIIEGQFRIVFSARFQRRPKYIYLISCPQVIRAPNFTTNDRELLRVKLESVMDRIPESEWDKLKNRYNITRTEWLVISDEQEEFGL
ncbi:hypothetical protein EYZ11_010444 [Aspergillus tanneri]|uniref:Uncharacterized protein n=1 Tax=Aspergillus tanneri TaxID=1220188 RepID=A0A4S3J5A3_9EURO|nr:uncharacterized protein ATNIH1004_001859 [Aspergillus tanneri]KAA8641394.1 hypothetical protein ATNIH1004_001859 [Aspergillus tanneri]THC90096.1 hypothetical protein EYZ11_010444 [Aspergillus tanneri]